MQQTWGFRTARAAMFATTCVLLAALGHILMSGTAIPWWALVAASGSIGTAAWIVADRERGVPFVVLGTAVAQAALHTIFSLAQTLVEPPPAVAPSASHAMHHMAHDAMPMAALPAGHQMTGTASYGMFVAHLVAALLCGLWLAYGERAAFATFRAFADLILLPLRLISRPPFTLHRPRTALQQFSTPFQRFLLAHAITSRGPPRGVAVS